MSVIVTEPGLYADLDEATYHADKSLAPELGRSLSVSGAKKLLESPARFAYDRDNPPAPKDVFDFGTVAHTLILGKGQDFEACDFDAWTTKAAKEARTEARAAGKVPILAKDLARAQVMADKVRNHPLTSAILSEGEAEKSAYWVDSATGVTRRARFDWLRSNAVVDLKTAADASPAGFASAAAKFGYHQQASWYQDAIEATTGERLPFIFIVVEKEAPHLLAVYDLDDFALEAGDRRNRRALEVYAECESSGEWPGYSTQIETLALPRWAN